MVDFGVELSCVTDIAGDSRTVSGFRVVGEAIARRWMTPRGRLMKYPDYGYDLTQFVNADMSPRELAALRVGAEAEALKDERVESIAVAVELTKAGVLLLSAVVVTAQGPFDLVVSVSATTLTLLSVT